MNTQRIPIEGARNRLATIWFLGSGVAFLLITIQSILGKYGDHIQEVWAWFVPIVMPTLALMLGVIGATALEDASDNRSVRLFFFQLSQILSLFYLVVVLLTMLLEPFAPPTLRGIKLYNMSNYWLGPLQSLVVAAITVLFTSQKKEAN